MPTSECELVIPAMWRHKKVDMTTQKTLYRMHISVAAFLRNNLIRKYQYKLNEYANELLNFNNWFKIILMSIERWGVTHIFNWIFRSAAWNVEDNGHGKSFYVDWSNIFLSNFLIFLLCVRECDIMHDSDDNDLEKWAGLSKNMIN